MSQKYCSQTNIPTVNEEAPVCPTPIKEECVFMTADRTTPVVINTDEDLKTVLDRILVYVKTLEDRIAILETP